MPSKKYYRSLLPHDLMNMIGNYAGDHMFKLRFTYSKKRKFLSTIFVVPRHIDLYYHPIGPFVLKKKYWQPVRLGNTANILHLLIGKIGFHKHVFQKQLHKLYILLMEVFDYTLHPKIIDKQQIQYAGESILGY